MLTTATRPTTGTPDSRIPLTPIGQTRLAARLERLEHEILPEIREALQVSREDPTIRAEFVRAVEEVERLGHALRHAVITDDLPDDPKTVELGDLVTVRFGDGSVDSVLIVQTAPSRASGSPEPSASDAAVESERKEAR
jgi:transcription elongation GreA/GreB family factor